jgi:glycosyltransferase involved in cell wall biosynthesis
VSSDETVSIVNSRRNEAMLHERVGEIPIVATAPANRVARLAWDRVALGRQLRGTTLYHGLHYTMPSPFGAARIVTIHDLTMLDNPEWHEPSKVAYFRHAMRRAAEEADGIIVPSHSVKDRFLAYFSPRVEVTVIPHGIYPSRTIREATARNGGEVLYVGTIEPRKGIKELVAAFELLADAHLGLRLRIIGQVGWDAEPILGAIRTSRWNDRIDVDGYVTESVLREAYANCQLFVYPSYAEGFGMPVLEAMSQGAPVVTTSPTAMSEIAGDCATYSAPGDVDGLAGAMLGVIDDPLGAAERARRGIERAAEFTWERSVRAHLALYRRLT